MIHVSEVSGKWVRDIRKFVKLNKTYIVKVLNVDEQKGHISLSLKRIAKLDRTRKTQEFRVEQKAEKILNKIARKKNITLQKAYELIGYELQEEFKDMFEAFELAAKSPEKLIARGIKKEWVEIIHEVAKESIVKKKIRIKAELDLKFTTGDGIEKIKEFLNNLINKYELNIKYISAPKYSVETESDNPKLAQKELIKQLTNAVSNMKDGEAEFKIIGEKK
jgi:translation initiation factor 2 subunit 1